MWSQECRTCLKSQLSKPAAVERYIAHQKEHHRRRSFQEELISFLRRHGVEYDQHCILTGRKTLSGSVGLGGSRLPAALPPATLSAPFQGALAFRHLRGQPALDRGAPLRSRRCAGLGGLTPPSLRTCLASGCHSVGEGGSCATALQGASVGDVRGSSIRHVRRLFIIAASDQSGSRGDRYSYRRSPRSSLLIPL
jgi:hypothetical protein